MKLKKALAVVISLVVEATALTEKEAAGLWQLRQRGP